MKTANYERFHQGVVAIWRRFKDSGDTAIKDILNEYKMPHCKREYYDSVYEQEEEPTYDFSVELRKYISSMKMNYEKKEVEEEKTEITQDELIEQCIAILKATGDYVIKKRVVTVTFEVV